MITVCFYEKCKFFGQKLCIIIHNTGTTITSYILGAQVMQIYTVRYIIVEWLMIWCYEVPGHNGNMNSSEKPLPLCIHRLIHRVNTLRLRWNEQHSADDIFKRIFFNENVWISINISLKFVPKGPINNITALVQIMAWRRSGDKPLSEPMMVSLLTHICVTWPQWVNGQFGIRKVRFITTLHVLYLAI